MSTLGHTGRKYLSEDELYATALEREPDATGERKAELRVQAGQNARHNVAFFDITFNVQKSVTLSSANAATYGLTDGSVYEVVVFQAERGAVRVLH